MTTEEMTITNRRDNIAQVLRRVDELGALHHLPPNVLADMGVALDEVLANIIRYAYSDEGVHEIRIRLTVGDGVLEAEIEDDGNPFNPLTIPRPHLAGSLRERSIGGLGIHFVKNLMSEVAYSFAGNRNRLVLKKHLTHRTEADTRGPA